MESIKSVPTIITPGLIPTHVRRVFEPEEVQDVFRRGILEGKGIDIDEPEKQEEVVVPITKEIEEICESVRDRVIWGVYGSDGQLKRITEIGKIEQLTKKDGRAFKELYMDGLRRQPEVFGSTYEAERLRRVRDFQTILQKMYVVGAKHQYHDENGKLQQRLVAMATLSRETGIQSHQAWFGKLYVHRAHWGRRLGPDITYHTLDHAAAQQDIAIVSLIVTTTNTKVIPFYESIGFKKAGIQHDAARVDGYSYDWLTMRLDMDTYRKVREGEIEYSPDSEQ